MLWDYSLFHGLFGDLYIIIITYLSKKKTKHPNTDLEVDYHGNGQSFEAFGSALHIPIYTYK